MFLQTRDWVVWGSREEGWFPIYPLRGGEPRGPGCDPADLVFPRSRRQEELGPGRSWRAWLGWHDGSRRHSGDVVALGSFFSVAKWALGSVKFRWDRMVRTWRRCGGRVDLVKSQMPLEYGVARVRCTPDSVQMLSWVSSSWRFHFRRSLPEKWAVFPSVIRSSNKRLTRALSFASLVPEPLGPDAPHE